MEYHFISILINNSQSGESTVLGELSHEITVLCVDQVMKSCTLICNM